jgi:hypothetical protein
MDFGKREVKWKYLPIADLQMQGSSEEEYDLLSIESTPHFSKRKP